MTRRTSIFILAIVIALQCGTMFYWGSQKTGYYIDELFTFEYAQNINNHKDSIEYMDDSPLWEVEEWLSVKDLKTRFTMEEGESVFDLPLPLTIKKFFFDRNYMWIINALETFFGGDYPPKWICICFNIFVLILFQLLLFFFFDHCLKFDIRVALLAVTMWGFCPLALGLSVFCRFYSWTLFLFLITIVLHKLMWDCKSIRGNLLYELAVVLVLWLAFKNSELIFVLGGALVLFFTAGLIVRKRYSQAACYCLPLVVGGLIVAWKKTSFLKVISHPSLYATGHGASARLVDYLVNASSKEKVFMLLHSVKSFAESIPGSIEMALLIVVLLLILYWSVRKRVRVPDEFSLILCGTAVVFWLFGGLCGLEATRYNSFMFLLVFILMWSFFAKSCSVFRESRIAYMVAFSIVLFSSIMPFFNRNVEYVYKWQESYQDFLSNHEGIDAIVNYDPVYNYNAYYSSFQLSESSSIYPICGRPTRGGLPDLPDSFLYWSITDWSPTETLDLIRESGYGEELIYEWGQASVYYCKRIMSKYE